MNRDIRELSPELTVEETTDDQLDVVSGGISIKYQQVKFEYKEQKGRLRGRLVGGLFRFAIAGRIAYRRP